MHRDDDHHRRTRYTLSDAEHGRGWGVCAEVDGLFGEPGRGTYELFGWTPSADVRGWVGSRVWLVPDDEALGPWCLEDAESPGRRPGADGLVLTGLDDYEGPPEGYRGEVRVHDGRRWLGSGRELTRILPAARTAHLLVLRGLAPGDHLRAALAKGTRRALDLGEATLEVTDDRGDPLTDVLLRATVKSWGPSACGPDLIDLELDGGLDVPVPAHARPVWEQWFAGPPDVSGAWSGLGTRSRGAWHDLVRERAFQRVHHDRPAGHAYVLDGRHITDVPGLYLALGEAVNGPGGYFGSCLDAVVDCLRGTFGYTAPATLLWRDAAVARERLSPALTPEGEPYDLFAEVLAVLAEGGMRVTTA
ncbi:barstar family protein [Streptomyces sp. NPDC003691]